MASLETWLRILNPPPVRVERARCLTARHQAAGCSACAQVCPSGALAVDGQTIAIDDRACMGCGLCAGACPTAAVQVRGVTLETASPDENGTVRLSCSQANGVEGGGVTQLPCLGWLTVDHGLRLAQIARRVELLTGRCADCPWARGGEMLAAVAERSERAARALGYEVDFVVLPTSGGGSEATVSRRGFFALVGVQVCEAGATLFEDWTEGPLAPLVQRVPARRRAWASRLGQVPAGADLRGLPLTGKQVTKECNACGVCAAACPTGALRLTSGDGCCELAHRPLDCLDCGLCNKLCPVAALQDVKPAALGNQVLATRWTRTCCFCRRPFMAADPEETCCPYCR